MCASAVEKIGKLVFWRVAIKPGRPVAMGVDAGRNAREQRRRSSGLPGNPVAAFVTFARVVRPLLLRLAGADAEPLIALPVRLAFRLQEENRPPRICARRAATALPMAAIEAVKHPQEGAGVHHVADGDRRPRRVDRRHDDASSRARPSAFCPTQR